MTKRFLLISEVLACPFDEGLKIFTFSLSQALYAKGEVSIITSRGNDFDQLEAQRIPLGKLFIGGELHARIKALAPEAILYVPGASTTVNSFIRARMLGLFHKGIPVALVGSQPRSYLPWHRLLLRYLKPDFLFLMGSAQKQFFQEQGFKVRVLPPAIDASKFRPVTPEKRSQLRQKYGLGPQRVVLHVGHVRPGRNIEQLAELQGKENMQVVVVGSTSTEADRGLKERLVDRGVRVMDQYIPAIEEIYQLADVYVFPVIRQDAAIEMPLSVLEAMACNLPVVTTRFGGLVEHFQEDGGFRYYGTIEELLWLLPMVSAGESANAEKVARFTWDNMADDVLSALKGPK